MSIVKSTVTMNLSLEETFDTTLVPFGNEGQKTVVSGGLNKTEKYDANSDPDGTAGAFDSLPLVAGVASINLAAVASAVGAVNLTGKALRAIILHAHADNTDPIKIAIGAANGYTGFGADFALTLDPGKRAVIQANGDAVGAANRILDVTGTDEEILEYQIVAGTA